MKFIVDTTTNKKDLPLNAKLETFWIENFYETDRKEYMETLLDCWHQGRNHKQVGDKWSREESNSFYTIEINSLEELMELYPTLVVESQHWLISDLPYIEIYNDYRE